LDREPGGLKTRDFRDVVAALLFLGCEKVVNEKPRAVTIVRGAVIMTDVPKVMVSRLAQALICDRLQIDRELFAKTVERIASESGPPRP